MKITVKPNPAGNGVVVATDGGLILADAEEYGGSPIVWADPEGAHFMVTTVERYGTERLYQWLLPETAIERLNAQSED